MKALTWRTLFAPRRQVASAPPSLPALVRPALRWVGEGNRIALRPFDWNADAQTVCVWQRETYALNFPDFNFTPEFESAFAHDLRRASLDEVNGLFMLDETAHGGAPCGFLWVVLCSNNWTGERYGYINNLYVAPAKRGQHLSDELLRHAEIWFKARRVSKLRLTVTGSNVAACKLYERMGYATQRLEMEKEI